MDTKFTNAITFTDILDGFKKYLNLEAIANFKRPLLFAFKMTLNKLSGGDLSNTASSIVLNQFRFFLMCFYYYLNCVILLEVGDINEK